MPTCARRPAVFARAPSREHLCGSAEGDTKCKNHLRSLRSTIPAAVMRTYLLTPPTPGLIHDPVASVLCIWRTRSCVYGVPVGLIHAIQCGVGLSLLTSMFRVQSLFELTKTSKWHASRVLSLFIHRKTASSPFLWHTVIRSVFCCNES